MLLWLLHLLSASALTSGQTCSAKERKLDVWASPSVVKQLASPEAWQIFDINGYRVTLGNTSKWIPSRMCSKWEDMSVGPGDPVNSEMCDYAREYGDSSANRMLKEFFDEYKAMLHDVYNVTSCIHKDPPRAYVTKTYLGLAPDDLHGDIDGEDCLPVSTRKRTDPLFLTVLTYPHERWLAKWEGHTEFVDRDCTDPAQYDRDLGRSLPAVLRIAPLPGRTIVFQGELLHRATQPTEKARKSVRRHLRGHRFSTVMQIVCFEGKQEL
eukprot:TRINITY_DN64863_c0_g1_i1.p1 TRINITY_DN64863_c0_g1~~TRINITY_DN64863_c0_g1_i1.p1  ORF type:complete len:267 (+),score=20.90 TRINITY_DN64863_c0_g1_i1:48-848(+)